MKPRTYKTLKAPTDRKINLHISNTILFFVVLTLCFVLNTPFINATGFEDFSLRSKSLALNEGGFLISIMNIEKMIVLYEQGLSCQEVGEKLNLDGSTIHKYLRINGKIRKKRSEQHRQKLGSARMGI